MTPLAALPLSLAILALSAPFARSQPDDPPAPLRAGIIGADTSHAIAFTKILNDPKAPPELQGVRVVAAYPGGSPDIPSSIDRVPEYTAQLRDQFGVEIVDSIDALLAKVDVVLLESVDGRPHWKQAEPVLRAGKRLFIDKPVAGSLADAVRIYDLAAKLNVPVFSSSALRFGKPTIAAKSDPSVGRVIGCDAYSPCALEEHHPDLFWYGIHGVESLYTIMGVGCVSVARTSTPGTDLVVGTWSDGRVGTFRGVRDGRHDYGVTVHGEKGIAHHPGFDGYGGLVAEIVKFFRTGTAPVAPHETIELYAFMAAADASKARGGAPVLLADILAAAWKEARAASAP
jgi:predicted dehydrogenase